MLKSAAVGQTSVVVVFCGFILGAAISRAAETPIVDRAWHYSFMDVWLRNNLAAPEAIEPAKLRLSGFPVCTDPPQAPCRDIAKTDAISATASQWWARFDRKAFMDLREKASSEAEASLVDQYLAYADALQAEAIALEKHGAPEVPTAQDVLRFSILTFAIIQIRMNQKIMQRGGWEDDYPQNLIDKSDVFQILIFTNEFQLYQVISARLADACALYTERVQDLLCDSVIRYDETMVASFERYTHQVQENAETSVEILRHTKKVLAEADEHERRYWQNNILGTSYYPMVSGLYDITRTDITVFKDRLETIVGIGSRSSEETDHRIRFEEEQYGDLEKYWKVEHGFWPDRTEAILAKE